MGRMAKIGEVVQRKRIKLAAVLAAGGLVLAGCGDHSALTEPIKTNHPVPTTETVTSSLLPGDETTTTMAPSRTYAPASTAETSISNTNESGTKRGTPMLVCLGAFVDKPNKTFTVNPVSELLPDPSHPSSKIPFPKFVVLQEGGNSRIEPAQPYRENERAEIDLRGNDMRSGGIPCEQRPVRVAHISPVGPGAVGTELALVGDNIAEGQVVDLSTPGRAEAAHEVYNQQFPYSSDAQLQGYIRSIQGAA